MNQTHQIPQLIEFIQRATKLGKYNSNTGGGFLNAVRAAERGLLAEEPKDVDYLISHLEELFFRQKDLSLSHESQHVYFTRIRRAVEDYKKYGLDAKAIYNWTPKQKPKRNNLKKDEVNVKSEETKDTEKTVINNLPDNSVIREVGGVKLNVVTWRLRPGVLVKIELPEDLTTKDVEKIKKLLDLEIE